METRFKRTGSIGPMIGILAIVLIAGFSCGGASNGSEEDQSDTAASSQFTLPAGFSDYWYQGEAELNRFRLKQARYGQIREGDAVLIFVTEDFLADEQVKLESPPEGRAAPSVLKLNFTKKFLTGIYPYSMMTSIFTPVDTEAWPHTLKVTTSSQEWCGHTYTQLNRTEPGYRLQQFSYFEKEGDVDREIEVDLIEDEIWTRVRLSPEDLPVGSITLLPGTMTARLRHTDHTPVEASARHVEIEKDSEGNQMMRYMVEYTNPPRTLKIDYRKSFPHDIVGWSETYNDFGKTLTTTATRTDKIKLDYWSRNALKDTILRRDLGLPTSR